MAVIDGIFIGNDMSFSFNSCLGSILIAIFFIAAAVEIPFTEQEPVLLVAIIFAALNCALLFFMGQKGQKGSLKGKSTESYVIIAITLLTVVQFSIAMGVEQPNVTNMIVGYTGPTWQYSILCLGAG